MREKFLDNLRMQIKVQCSIFDWSLQMKVLAERVVIERMGMLTGMIRTGFSLDLIEYDEFTAFIAFVNLLGEELMQEIREFPKKGG